MRFMSREMGFFMIIKNVFRIFLLSNVVFAGLMVSNFPATAARVNANNVPNDFPTSGFLLAQVNTKFAQEADQHIGKALSSMNEAAEATSDTHALKSFTTALDSFGKASTALKKAGMNDSAKKMDSCIQALSKAIETNSKEEEDKLIENAVNYLQQIAGDIEKVLS
jgi:Skp family chaperone for outer membrane proteins